MWIERLKNTLYRDDALRGVLAILADQTVEEKREGLYPELVPLVVEQLVAATPPKEPRSLAALLAFLKGELAGEPALAGRLYQEIGGRPVRHGRAALFDLIAAARDRRGVPLLRGGAKVAGWVDAVIATEAAELAPEIAAALEAEPSRELATAAAFAGGEGMRSVLAAGSVRSRGARMIGLAFLADAGEKDFFAKLDHTTDEAVARRIHTLRTARGHTQRLTALDELVGELADRGVEVGAEHLMAFTCALEDKRPDLVQRGAALLAAYIKAQGKRARLGFGTRFLRSAAAAIERGVTREAREYLERVRARLPGAPPFGEGAVVAPPPTREQAARARGEEMIEAMQLAVAAGATDRRDAVLEAQIAAAPDDEQGYLVYADWLQQQGDPRGAWIALHTTKGLAARAAIGAFLAQHRAALLGPLAPYEPELAWFMGFVQRARITGPDAAEIARALLDAPCGAFVRELVFAECDEAAVVEVMLAKRPQTLERLALGTRDEVTPALAEAMPRLVRDPRAQWEAVLEKLAAQRKVKVELGAELPPLVPVVPGVAYDRETILRGLKSELALDKPIGLCAAIRRGFSPDSVDEFARELAQVGLEHARSSWAVAAAGALGGDRTARFLSTALEAMYLSRERVAGVLDHLGRIGTGVAIEELARVAFDLARHPRDREHARGVLAGLAGLAAEGELDALVARAAPSADERGLQAQRRWLESLMTSGRGLPRDAFAAGVLGAPMRLADARTLLWAERDEGGEIVGLFRVNERGEPVRRDGRPYELRQRVGLAHPAELSPDELAGARRAFAGVAQAILQLARPVLAMSAAEARTKELTRFVRRRVGFDAISVTLLARGWSVAASDTYDDDGEERWAGTRAFARDLERDRVRAIATLNETRGSIACVTVLRGARSIAFDELHVVTISELLFDLEAAHGRSFDEPPPPPPQRQPQPQPPGPGRAPPVVERARTGRSKCVVCAAAIAKDSLRIGVERMIETPAFRGLATVWAHPACRDGVPELEGALLELG